MSSIIFAVIAVAVIGLICAIILAIASKVMAVPVNETEKEIRECLPGANCGACGYAGCDGYAAALAAGDESKTNLCVPGSEGVAKKVAAILGVKAEEVVEKVAVVHCKGNCEVTKNKMDYQGIQSCKAAKLFYGGHGSCTYGCIGLGDCMNVCPKNAISINKGVADIDRLECIGCGMCAKICPNGVISVEVDTIKTLVKCNNQNKGAVTRKLCTAGCIACMKCVKNCPEEAISIENNLATIHYEKCSGCGKCAEVCVTGAIHLNDYSGMFNNAEAEKAAAAFTEK